MVLTTWMVARIKSLACAHCTSVTQGPRSLVLLATPSIYVPECTPIRCSVLLIDCYRFMLFDYSILTITPDPIRLCLALMDPLRPVSPSVPALTFLPRPAPSWGAWSLYRLDPSDRSDTSLSVLAYLPYASGLCSVPYYPLVDSFLSPVRPQD